MDKPTKKIAIVADNYKVKNFKRELKKADYDFKQKALGRAVTGIFIRVPVAEFDDHVKTISKICKKVNIDVKLSN